MTSNESAATAVGIDLGTTFSVVAALDERGTPYALRNAEGDLTTPSAILFDKNGIVVGKEALKAAVSNADQVALCVKREMGARVFPRRFGGQEYPPQVLQAFVLDKLRRDAELQIGPFRRAVITVPAYFDESRRKATQEAGYMAGLDVIDIINEPTAAAVAFGYRQGWARGTRNDEPLQRILVYDLGGGTLDVTVMEYSGNDYRALSTDGDMKLGGRDWDQRLMDYVSEYAIRHYDFDPRHDPASDARLWRECEDAKRTLSARNATSIPCEFRGHAMAVEVTREQFEEMTQDLLDRTALTVRQALASANVTWDGIDRVLLVGGSSRMPAVETMMRKMSGKKLDRSVSPDEAIAHGAALHAGAVLQEMEGHEPHFRVRNVNSHSLGVVAIESANQLQRNVIIIPKNSRLPAKRKQVFHTQLAGQRSVLVRVVEGESMFPDDCMQIGRMSIHGLPPNLPAKTPIEVSFGYRSNGRLTVNVQIQGVAVKPRLQLTRETSLGKDQLERWRKWIAKQDGLPESQ
jgi:molecular chaperone DnaK